MTAGRFREDLEGPQEDNKRYYYYYYSQLLDDVRPEAIITPPVTAP